MTNLVPSWQTCRVIGTWLTGDHAAMRPGTYKIEYPRLTNTKQQVVVPGGVFAQAAL